MNIEAHIIQWLNSLDLGCRAYADVPPEYPEEFVQVIRIGGQRDSVAIDRPRIALQLWAGSNERAAELAYQLDELVITGLRQDSRISKVSRTALYSYSGSDSGHARYQIELDIVCVI